MKGVFGRRGFQVWLMFAAALLACASAWPTRARAGEGAGREERKATPAAPVAAARPFEPSEELVYEGEFSKLLLRGIKIAELKFTAGRAPATTNAAGQTVATATQAASAGAPDVSGVTPSNASAPLLFTGEVTSRGWFRKLFGINFHYRVESTVEPKTFAVLRTAKLDEQGKRVRTSEAVFDRAAAKITWTERDPNDPARPPRVVSSPLADASHDIITAIYFLRTQALTPGQTFDLAVSDSGAVYHIPARVYAEKKRMKSIVGRVPVVRVEVEMFGEGRLVGGEGRMSVWMTDDERHLPVRARLDSQFGALDLTLKSFNGKTRA